MARRARSPRGVSERWDCHDQSFEHLCVPHTLSRWDLSSPRAARDSLHSHPDLLSKTLHSKQLQSIGDVLANVRHHLLGFWGQKSPCEMTRLLSEQERAGLNFLASLPVLASETKEQKCFSCGGKWVEKTVPLPETEKLALVLYLQEGIASMRSGATYEACPALLNTMAALVKEWIQDPVFAELAMREGLLLEMALLILTAPSPENIARHATTAPADIFALGVAVAEQLSPCHCPPAAPTASHESFSEILFASFRLIASFGTHALPDALLSYKGMSILTAEFEEGNPLRLALEAALEETEAWLAESCHKPRRSSKGQHHNPSNGVGAIGVGKAEKARLGKVQDKLELLLEAVQEGLCDACRCMCAYPSCAATCDDAQLKVCSRCRAVWYCSQECQKRDWHAHKIFCHAAATSPSSQKPEVGDPFILLQKSVTMSS